MKTENVVIYVFAALAVLLAVIAVYFIALKITGHSPTELTLFGVVISALVAIEITNTATLLNINKSLGRLEEFKDNAISNLKRLNDKVFKHG